MARVQGVIHLLVVLGVSIGCVSWFCRRCWDTRRADGAKTTMRFAE